MKVLAIDDHALVRQALRGVFEELRPDAVVLEAVSRRQALALLEEHADIALVLLDLSLPDADGFDLLVALRARLSSAAIVVLSARQDRDTVATALRLGALGFIPKSASYAVMLAALQVVFAGGIYVPPEILAEPDVEKLGQSLAPAEQATTARPPTDLGLTERQRAVLALLMHGRSNKAICRHLGLAEATVKNHITAIFRALRVTNRTEAVIAAGELGVKLPLPPSTRETLT
jgi:DNA-binding NarL/FixJ family response regulator